MPPVAGKLNDKDTRVLSYIERRRDSPNSCLFPKPVIAFPQHRSWIGYSFVNRKLFHILQQIIQREVGLLRRSERDHKATFTAPQNCQPGQNRKENLNNLPLEKPRKGYTEQLTENKILKKSNAHSRKRSKHHQLVKFRMIAIWIACNSRIRSNTTQITLGGWLWMHSDYIAYKRYLLWPLSTKQ